MATLNTTGERADQEAADWFARLNTRAISTPALEAFHAWRRDPANDAAYNRMEAVWETAGALGGDPDIARGVAGARLRGTWRRRLGALRRPAVQIGALALVAGAAAIYLALAIPGTTYSTRIGEQRLVTLQDGTRVRLDTDSRLQVRLKPGERDVRLLKGQAFFDVAHDKSRPFIVQADGAKVRALGTRFDVRLKDAQVHVTLIEGAVEVTHHGAGATRSWRLTPGQALATGSRTPGPLPVDVAAATSWTSGQLVFHATPLAEAVAEVNRYSRVKVVVDTAQLQAVAVNGKFDAGDTDAFVTAVCDLFNLSASSPDGGQIRLRPKAG